MGPASDANRVHIFDTTLRDCEQSPGISLNTAEKVEIAQQLARLGVDVIEAGFPITSPGDFEAVQRISQVVEGPVVKDTVVKDPVIKGTVLKALGPALAARAGRQYWPRRRSGAR